MLREHLQPTLGCAFTSMSQTAKDNYWISLQGHNEEGLFGGFENREALLI